MGVTGITETNQQEFWKEISQYFLRIATMLSWLHI